jgi:hypothetical protein
MAKTSRATVTAYSLFVALKELCIMLISGTNLDASGISIPVDVTSLDSSGIALETGGNLDVLNTKETAIAAVAGTTAGAAVITDTNGTLQQYLRGIVKLILAKIPATLADGDDATQGITTGAAVTTDIAGTIQQYLRGIIKQLVALIGTATTPSASVLTTQRPAVTQVVSTALEASHIIKNAAGQLWRLDIFNSKGSAQFALIINSATLPGDGAVTLLYPPIPLPANTSVSLIFHTPLVASTGIVISNSSTGTFTKTIGSADCAFYAQIN